MKILDKINENAKIASNLLTYDIEFSAGVTEDLDRFTAHNSLFNIRSSAPTEEEANAWARVQAESYFINFPSLAEKLIRENSLKTKH